MLKRFSLRSLLLLATLGCTAERQLETLPPAGITTDDIQYFAPGSHFELAREAAEMKAYQADQEASGPSVTTPPEQDGTPPADFDFSFDPDSFGPDLPAQ